MMKFLLILLIPFYSLAQVKEAWIDKPKDRWPSIALVNDVLYKNGDRHQDPSVSYVGTGFLLDAGHDTFAITVKHALFAARNNKTDRVVENEHLQTWKMYPKNDIENTIIIDSLINEDSTEKLFSGDNGVLQRDWLVFAIKSISPNIVPLKLSESNVNVGDSIHLIGNPYKFPQTLYVSGKVIKKSGEHIFIKLNGIEKQVLGGASGSPIVNDKGHLIGIFSNSKRDPKTGETTYIVNNTGYLKRVLNHEKPLNIDKRSLAVLLDSLLHQMPVKQALALYTKLIDDPASADIYEVHYINWNHLQKIGEHLLQTIRAHDAIQYASYFTTRNSELVGFHLLLARAYKQNNENKKAIAVLEHALREVFEEDKPDVLKLIEELRR